MRLNVWKWKLLDKADGLTDTGSINPTASVTALAFTTSGPATIVTHLIGSRTLNTTTASCVC